MTPLDLWRHELRRIGWAALVTPPAAAALVALLAVLQSFGTQDDASTARTFHDVLAMGIPLAVGVVAGSLIGRDPVAELQLSVVREYRATLLRRLLLAAGWAAVVAVVATVAVVASGWWYRLPSAPDPVAGQLTWLAPSLALGGLGFLVAALSRTAALAAGLVSGVWLVELMIGDTLRGSSPLELLNLFARRTADPGAWLANRAVLLALGAALLLAAWGVLARPEHLLKGEEG
ncbi:hypothetical protein [Labedaea rhizosphaerae]|nr:hypothetical protein [Labedaea rhizosphaerae]